MLSETNSICECFSIKKKKKERSHLKNRLKSYFPCIVLDCIWFWMARRVWEESENLWRSSNSSMRSKTSTCNELMVTRDWMVLRQWKQYERHMLKLGVIIEFHCAGQKQLLLNKFTPLEAFINSGLYSFYEKKRPFLYVDFLPKCRLGEMKPKLCTCIIFEKHVKVMVIRLEVRVWADVLRTGSIMWRLTDQPLSARGLSCTGLSAYTWTYWLTGLLWN